MADAYDGPSWDDMTDALLCGSDVEDNDVPPAPRVEASTTAPRASGGFAASGKAAPLVFDDLRVGMIIVRRAIDEKAGLFGANGGRVPPPVSSVTAAAAAPPPARDLLAALRSRTQGGGGVAAAAVAVPPPPAAPKKSIYGVNWEASLDSDYVTEADANAQGVSQAQLYTLATTMLCVTALARDDQTVVVTKANGDVATIRQFGQTATAVDPAERGNYYRAGLVEEGLFAQWRADPPTLAAVMAKGDGSRSAELGVKRPREEEEGSAAAVVSIEGILAGPRRGAAGGAAAAAVWWAVKGLCVRYVPADGEDTNPNFGKKGPIVECSQKDNRVTLRLEVDPIDGDADGRPGFALVRCGIADVDTVVPKVGGRVMVLRPDLAGEISSVVARAKDPATGDPLVTVVVDDERVTLKAEEVCQMA